MAGSKSKTTTDGGTVRRVAVVGGGLASIDVMMRRRVKVLSMAVLQPIQLAAIAISTAFQKRRAARHGISAFIKAAIITNGTCTIVFTARSSVPKANRAPVQVDPIDSPFEAL